LGRVFGIVDDDLVALGLAGEEAAEPLGLEPAVAVGLLDPLVLQTEQVLFLDALSGARGLAAVLPVQGEKGLQVELLRELLEAELDLLRANEGMVRARLAVETDGAARQLREQVLGFAGHALGPLELLLELLQVFFVDRRAVRGGNEGVHNVYAVHGGGAVKDVAAHVGLVVGARLGDVGRVPVVDRRPADKHGQVAEALLAHHLCHGDHVVRGLHEQGRHADGVRVVLFGGVQVALEGGHHAEVDDAVAVVLEEGLGEVLADRMHVLEDRADDDGALVLDLGMDVAARGDPHVLFEEAHDLLHHVGRLQEMGQETSPRAKPSPSSCMAFMR
jgi:hypothetical protein